MPSLKGSHAEQAREIISMYVDGNINEEQARTLTLLLNTQAEFVPLEVYKKQIEELKEAFEASKIHRNKQ